MKTNQPPVLTLPKGWSTRKFSGWLNPWRVVDASGQNTRYAGPTKKQAIANALPDVGVPHQPHAGLQSEAALEPITQKGNKGPSELGALQTTQQDRPDKEMPTYFVAVTDVYEQVKDPGEWTKVGATTLDGAKRIATKRATRATFTARIAIKSNTGEMENVAQMDNSFAITRCRPKWRECSR